MKNRDYDYDNEESLNEMDYDDEMEFDNDDWENSDDWENFDEEDEDITNGGDDDEDFENFNFFRRKRKSRAKRSRSSRANRSKKTRSSRKPRRTYNRMSSEKLAEQLAKKKRRTHGITPTRSGSQKVQRLVLKAKRKAIRKAKPETREVTKAIRTIETALGL